jgi:hypothetical protein
LSGRDGKAGAAQSPHEIFVQFFGLIGRRRIAKGRAIALPAIAIQCELRYDQNFFPYFLHGKIHLAILVLKNSQIFDLVRKLIDVSLAIGFTDS